MRFGSPLVIICLLGWASVPASAAEDAGSVAPCLNTPEKTWDFGEVAEGKKPEHEFAVENAGDAPLTIRRMLQSCGGCFDLNLAKQELQPGERTTLKVVVLTARRRGSFRKYVYLESNDPKAGRRRITITGTIKPSQTGEGTDDKQGAGGQVPAQDLEKEMEQEIALDPAPSVRTRMPVCVTYFTSATCEECRATHKALEKLGKQHESLAVRAFDIDELDQFNVLLKMEKAYGPFKNSPPIIYVGTELLDGWDEVKAKLGSTVRARLEDGKAAEWPPEVAGAGKGDSLGLGLVREKFNAISTLAIMSAGFVDGLNPCAFTTIVLFVSLLARFGKSRRETITVGVCFTLAGFVTYFLLGVGLLKAIQVFSVTSGVAKGITYAIAGLAIVFGGYSVYDYIVWRRNRSGAEMKLKLPRAVHQRIHAVMKAGLSARSLVAAALVTGVCVSVLESICTGQVYLPTIAFVLRDPSLRLHALGYLVLYNAMFILPLVVIFVLACFGLQSATLARFAQRHTGTVKLLLAVVFFGLAVLLILTTGHSSALSGAR